MKNLILAEEHATTIDLMYLVILYLVVTLDQHYLTLS